MWITKVEFLDMEGRRVTNTSVFEFTNYDAAHDCYTYFKNRKGNQWSSVHPPVEISPRYALSEWKYSEGNDSGVGEEIERFRK